MLCMLFFANCNKLKHHQSNTGNSVQTISFNPIEAFIHYTNPQQIYPLIHNTTGARFHQVGGSLGGSNSSPLTTAMTGVYS